LKTRSGGGGKNLRLFWEKKKNPLNFFWEKFFGGPKGKKKIFRNFWGGGARGPPPRGFWKTAGLGPVNGGGQKKKKTGGGFPFSVFFGGKNNTPENFLPRLQRNAPQPGGTPARAGIPFRGTQPKKKKKKKNPPQKGGETKKIFGTGPLKTRGNPPPVLFAGSPFFFFPPLFVLPGKRGGGKGAFKIFFFFLIKITKGSKFFFLFFFPLWSFLDLFFFKKIFCFFLTFFFLF